MTSSSWFVLGVKMPIATWPICFKKPFGTGGFSAFLWMQAPDLSDCAGL